MKTTQNVKLLVIIALIFSLLGPPSILRARADNDPLPVHPDLLQAAQNYPDEVFSVIVQKARNNGNGNGNGNDPDPEEDVSIWVNVH